MRLGLSYAQGVLVFLSCFPPFFSFFFLFRLSFFLPSSPAFSRSQSLLLCPSFLCLVSVPFPASPYPPVFFLSCLHPPVAVMPTGKTEPVRLASINVKGLNTPEKRSMVLANLKHMKAQVCFLQETHFRADKTLRLHDSLFPTVYHGCSSDSKSRGVSILI